MPICDLPLEKRQNTYQQKLPDTAEKSSAYTSEFDEISRPDRVSFRSTFVDTVAILSWRRLISSSIKYYNSSTFRSSFRNGIAWKNRMDKDKVLASKGDTYASLWTAVMLSKSSSFSWRAMEREIKGPAAGISVSFAVCGDRAILEWIWRFNVSNERSESFSRSAEIERTARI